MAQYVDVGGHSERTCQFCGKTLGEDARPNKIFCDSNCRLGAFRRRKETEEIRRAQEHSVADVKRQLAEGTGTVFFAGMEINAESAWAAIAGIEAIWKIEGARQTGRVFFQSGQWWVIAHVPLGEFPYG